MIYVALQDLQLSSEIVKSLSRVKHPVKVFDLKKDEFENSEMYYKRAISIPIFSSMSLDQQDKIVSTIKRVLL